MTARQAAQAAGRALRAVIAAAKALAAAATSGGGIVIAVVIVICLCGIILASPLGIFFAGSDETTRAVSPAQAVAQINGELGEKISSMQADGGYDTLEIQGQPPPWSDILAVFARQNGRHSGRNNGGDTGCGKCRSPAYRILGHDKADLLLQRGGAPSLWRYTSLDRADTHCDHHRQDAG